MPTLADLYDPLSTPRPLAEAHAALDRAVDHTYRGLLFPSDRHRFEFLFNLCERLTTVLTPPPPHTLNSELPLTPPP